ncbi:ABC transporter substrate-binding protein [Agromyces aerolatus]|uniref:ABC transporter substrate-binding protein n=1 Tax=Agromyces sp. LY-1074 TaxID=3074080 RepID=UPI002861075B|nr:MULTISPECIES: ABC transporter substrate-binding protein [unclassified Agromyces]MDR5700933.1 ABC transporter substrate-binding protein [Agromyces sp. LY-1074]MDR5707406.1 ABC transporter substrate-binding protein [Agromyces sp. LY-1358]
MGKKSTRSVAGAAALLVAMAVSGCAADSSAGEGGSEGGSETTTVRVATSVSNSFPFVVVQAGQQLGTWEDSGIEVEVVEGTTPTIGQIMAGGQADIALAAASTEAASRQSGVEMTIVASNLSYWDQRIIARPGTADVAELEGGNFGITGAGSPGDYSVVKMAEESGWAESDYTVTSLGNLQALIAALTAGSIDAFAWSSQAAFQMEESGEGVIVADGADFVGENVLQSFAVMDQFAADNPETVQAFFEAYFATVERIQADPQLFIDVLVDEWDVNPAVAERLAEESLPELSTDGVITEGELEGIRDAVAFSLETSVDDVEPVAYTYWKDLK